MNIQFQHGFILLIKFATHTGFNLVQYFSKVLADKNRNDRRRGFVGAKAVVVACTCNRCP